MTVTQPTLISELASEFLMASADVLTDPPARQYVSHNEPAHDCEQLTVHLVYIRPRPTVGGEGRCAVQLQATFAVTLLRCYPSATDTAPIPDAGELGAASLALLDDGWSLIKGLTRKWATETTPFGLPCKQTSWGGIEPRGPTDLAGWRLEVQVDLLPVPT